MTMLTVEELVRQFTAMTLPSTEWTHRAHLGVALWYLRRHDRVAATCLIREGIQRYNAASGRPQGYHETITLAWVSIVLSFLDEHNDGSTDDHLLDQLVLLIGDSKYLERFYSRDRLMSAEARLHWLAPETPTGWSDTAQVLASELLALAVWQD